MHWNRLMIATLKVVIRKLDIKEEILEEARASRKKWPDESAEAPTFTEYVFGKIDLDKEDQK